MANEAEVFGLPQVLIDFKTKGTTAIKRSARGIVAMILKNEETDVSKYYKINDVSDIPDKGLTAENVDLIKKCLLGTPLRILVYTLPKANISEPTQKLAGILAKLESVKWNYLCYPNSTEQEQQDIVSWIKSERGNKRKTFKAVVANQAADHEGIINFCTGGIKVKTDTDSKGNPVYTTYTAPL
jgi:hypothetical protein